MDPQTLAQATLYVLGLFLRHLVAADEAADREAVNIHGVDAWRAARMLWAALEPVWQSEPALRQQVVAQAKTPQPDLAGVQSALLASYERNPALAGDVTSVLAHSPYAGLLGSDTGPLSMPSPELARQAESVAPDHLLAEHNRMLRTVAAISAIRWALVGAIVLAELYAVAPGIELAFGLLALVIAQIAIYHYLRYLGSFFSILFSLVAGLPVAPWILLVTTISSRSRHNPTSAAPLRFVWLMGLTPFFGLLLVLIFQPLALAVFVVPELTQALLTSAVVLWLGSALLFVLFRYRLLRNAWLRALVVSLFSVLCAFPAMYYYMRTLNAFLLGPDF